MAEFTLIQQIRARVEAQARAHHDVVLGIGDDAALLQPPPGMQLVVTMDTLNDGVHFPTGTDPDRIGWKALAVNLSDLAAMGADPAWCTLSLSLPADDPAWVDAFMDGFLALAGAHRVALVGGDTTRGPLAVSVTAHGLVSPGQALRRDGAVPGDDVWISGTLGDAAGALDILQRGGAGDAALSERLDRPQPRLRLGATLRGIASACIDVSDGLLADLGHICIASGVAATVDADDLPASAALRRRFTRELLHALQLAGGDDYELCFTAPAAASAAIERAGRETDTPVTRIGAIAAGAGATVRGARMPARTGYQHFPASAG
ncbi:thiamine-phosphate kinase [Luteimonas sp. MJ246]|uniref:thiamine-phosphate kinase n=1 Tax=Luteimonas sp. MJ174 TaxID=3129237 RepID=UPI0031BA1AF2